MKLAASELTIPERYKVNTSSFSHYWTKGIGASLLDQLAQQPNLTAADQFIPLLYAHDLACDHIVERVHVEIGFKKGQQLVVDYLRGQPIPKKYDQILSDFIGSLPLEPHWIDWKLLQQGINLCQRSGLSGLIVLRDYCLMGGYESSAINKPLIFTGALKKGAVKRLTETVTFWVDITGDDALKKGGVGIEAILLTRCIHSYARINLLKNDSWEVHKWGTPLNTWDMLATNLGFSLVYLVGLKRMKFNLLKHEIDGIFHLWKYVGTLLGIPLELLPDTEEDAIKSLYYWTMTQKEGDNDSIALAQALMEEPLRAAYPRSKFGRKLMREVHLYYNNYLLGTYSCALLGLEKTTIGKIAYYNILKNKKENRFIEHDDFRARQIKKGREVHEGVKKIYQTYN